MLSHRSYHTGHLKPRDVLRNAGRRRVVAATLREVGTVQRRRFDVDEYLVEAEGGVVPLDDLEDLGTSGLGNDGGSHGDLLRWGVLEILYSTRRARKLDLQGNAGSRATVRNVKITCYSAYPHM